MGFLKKLQKAAKKAGKIGQRLPTTEEMIYGRKPKKKRRR
jgi:hypothetical protein